MLDEFAERAEKLSPEQNEQLAEWYALQRLVIHALGLSPEVWYQHVAWGLDHLHDDEFLRARPEGVSTAAGSARREAARVTGSTLLARAPVVQRSQPAKPATTEIQQRILLDRQRPRSPTRR